MDIKQKRRIFDLERGDFLPFMLILPTLAIVIIVMIIPFVWGLILSFCNYGPGQKITAESFIGLSNYVQMFKDKVFWKSLINTVEFSIGAMAGDLIMGTLIAVLLTRLRSRTVANILRAIFLMPLLISPIIIGLIWRYMYDPASGFLYWILSFFNITVNEFPGISMPSTAMFCVIIAHWWQVVPFVILVVTAGLVSISEDLYEAAYLEGSGPFHSFFHISLPLLKNVYMVILVISGVDTVKVFDIIYALTQGGPANSTMSMSLYAYNKAFIAGDMGYAMAVAIAIMIVSFAIFGIPFVKANIRKSEA